ncbi:hypothetical protein BHM03_00005876 [Ensete ventricosum]|nr:hypothetical protein BHM03_00005876 [Ensete ventricosum]
MKQKVEVFLFQLHCRRRCWRRRKKRLVGSRRSKGCGRQGRLSLVAEGDPHRGGERYPRLRQIWKVVMDVASFAVGKGHVASSGNDFSVPMGITGFAILSLLCTLLYPPADGALPRRGAAEDWGSGGKEEVTGALPSLRIIVSLAVCVVQ